MNPTVWNSYTKYESTFQLSAMNQQLPRKNNVVIQKEVKVWLVKEYPTYDMPKNSVSKFEASANDIYLKMRRKFVSVRQTAVDYM